MIEDREGERGEIKVGLGGRRRLNQLDESW